MNKKYLQIEWLTGYSIIGIVLRDTGFGVQAYMLNVSGFDEEKDIQQILDHGIKLTKKQASGFFDLSNYKYKGEK